jgi:hypothetical protein
MAKTLIQGSFGNSEFNTCYTCPSTKYARVTIIYFNGHKTSSLDPTNSGITYGKARLLVNTAVILDGSYPFSGLHYTDSGTAWEWSDRSLQDDAFIVPPSATVRLNPTYYSGSYRYVSYCFLVEEIDKTTVEA